MPCAISHRLIPVFPPFRWQGRDRSDEEGTGGHDRTSTARQEPGSGRHLEHADSQPVSELGDSQNREVDAISSTQTHSR